MWRISGGFATRQSSLSGFWGENGHSLGGDMTPLKPSHPIVRLKKLLVASLFLVAIPFAPSSVLYPPNRLGVSRTL